MTIFDIMGPIMVGPSSSHTAGAVRIGLIARKLLGSAPIMPIATGSPARFIHRGGRIPAPIQSLKN